MDKPLFDRIVQQLLPEMGDMASRKALVESALYGSPVLIQIDWSGAAFEFTIRLIKRLYEYDVSTVIHLLNELRTQVGITRQEEIDELIQTLAGYHISKKGRQMDVEPGILIGFLLEVGRWAKAELSERWQLRREQQTADLSSRSETEATVPAQIESIVAEKNSQEVERVIALIERKRDAIFRARNAKLADREEFDQQRLTKSAFEQRAADHNKTIRQMLDEIEADLNDLGFDVEREPA